MNKQQRLSLVLKYVGLSLLTVAFLFPFAWMLATSLKTNTEALTNPTSLLPAVPQWGNYPAVIVALNFWRETLNSSLWHWASPWVRFSCPRWPAMPSRG